VLIHPNYKEQVGEMVKRYRDIATQQGGKIHRFEDWGRIPLEYIIQDARKAYFLLFNIECLVEVHSELVDILKRNDAVMRHLVIRRKEAVVKPSAMYRKLTEKTEQDEQRQES